MSWYRVPLWVLWPDIICCRNVAVWNLRSCIWGGALSDERTKSKLLYDWQSVGQSVCLGIEYPCGTCDQILFAVGTLLSEICGLVSGGRPLWREDEVEVTLRLTVSQSVSMSWYRVPLWDLWPDIISCRNVAVWNLRSCIYWAPSLTRGRVCNLHCNHSIVRVAQNPKLYFTVSSETHPTWRARFPYLYPPGTGCLYRKLLYPCHSILLRC
jgi:hypothetical protein